MAKCIIKEAKDFVNRILTPLDKHYYHSYEHALDVMQRAVYLAEREWLSSADIEMLALAWLFHDTGFVVKYDKNEAIWAKIAENYLKSISYPADRIQKIQEIILATDPDYKKPKNIYEKIIKDSDMDNLWRDDFLEKSNNIKKELETIKKIKIKDPDWHHSLVDLLLEYKFRTKSQKQERDIKKEENLEKMLKEIKEKYKSPKTEELKKYLKN